MPRRPGCAGSTGAGLGEGNRDSTQNAHIPMFVTAPLLEFPPVVVEQVQPAPVV